MGRYIKHINGIPTTVDEALSATYQAVYNVSSALSINDQITLPNSETYDGTKEELKVERNGVGWIEGTHYQYQNNSSATYITVLIDVPSGGTIEFFKVG